MLTDPAALVYIYLNHRAEVKMGFRNLWNSFRKNKSTEVGQYKDVHNRLMAQYPEGEFTPFSHSKRRRKHLA